MMVYFLGYYALGCVLCCFIMIKHAFRKPSGNERELSESQRDNRSFAARCAEWVAMLLVIFPFVVLVWPWILWGKLFPGETPPRRGLGNDFAVSDDFLICALPLADIEFWETVDDPLGAAPPVPFGHLNPAWEAFKQEAGNATLWRFYGRADSGWGMDWRHDGYVALKEDGTRPYFMTRRTDVQWPPE